MGPDPYEPRDRLSAYLRGQYSEHASKRLAGDIACTPKTAENILSGHWPNSRHWAAIVRRFGRDVLDAVFGPDIDETTARLQAEVRELEIQLEAKRAGLVQAGGLVARPASRGAGLEDRAAANIAPDRRARDIGSPPP